uniref:Predicted protein n=1 Tax=Hordeum vulgare subsp. vulgare TaxID=112509 RepID=F2DAZ6_HORVV|nr:predicted protein [Hordeum vulgare subsp. vulgare]
MATHGTMVNPFPQLLSQLLFLSQRAPTTTNLGDRDHVVRKGNRGQGDHRARVSWLGRH